MNNENAIQVAIGKLNAAKGARESLAVGDYPVDAMVHVVGYVRVGDDYETTPTTSVPLKETLALFVKYCGVTRNAALAALENAMRDAIEATGKGKGALLEMMPELNKIMAQVEATLAKLPPRTCKGAVTAKLKAEVVAPAMVAATRISIEAKQPITVA